MKHAPMPVTPASNLLESNASQIQAPRSPARLAIAVALAIVSLAYLAQIATPLRLITDGIDYLLQASSAIDGKGFLSHGLHSMRPPGYPALIFLLAKAGIATSWAIVALNCLLLGIGCWASYFLLRDSFGFSSEVAQFIVLLTLLSFIFIRNATYPLSDICFFGASTSYLLVLMRTEPLSRSRRFWRLILSLPLFALCFELRTIGIALLPALLWAALGGASGARSVYPILRRHRIITFTLLSAILVIGIVALLHSRYLEFNLPIFHARGFARGIATNIEFHATEWGEMISNVPASKLPHVLVLPLRIFGVLAILTCAVGIWTKRSRPDSLMLYVLASASIVLAYPWADTRLWLPVLPFLMAYVFTGLKRLISPGALRPLLAACCLIFCALGVVALGFSTRLTYSGARFPEIYGDGYLRDAYRVVLLGETRENNNPIHRDAVYLLRRYEWRAARKLQPQTPPK
jgi:hypothetical protein